nr:hypothetical protein [Pseudomonadota bacterium]
MIRLVLNDAQWERVAPLLPGKAGDPGRTAVDKLDIAVRPSGAVFSTSRDAAGLDAVIGRLARLAPEVVAIEA